MKKSNRHQTSSKVSFATKEVNWISPYIQLFTEEALWRDMENAAEVEDYESAIIYRDELIKRGDLLRKNP